MLEVFFSLHELKHVQKASLQQEGKMTDHREKAQAVTHAFEPSNQEAEQADL